MDNVVNAPPKSGFLHIIGTLEPHPRHEDAYAGELMGLRVELHPARDGKGEHRLAVMAVLDTIDRPSCLILAGGQK